MRALLARCRRWVMFGVLLLALLPSLAVLAYAVFDPPLTPLMLIRWAEGLPLRRSWRPLEGISPHLVHAVIAAEDNLFCSHRGFDTGAIEGELRGWLLQGERPRGASTITMQTAKNILLWPGRDPLRKVVEAWMTPQIEAVWGKQRIMEVYLNVIEMGPGVYGAEAAARVFFGKPASGLTRNESALIAAVLPNPRRWHAGRPDPVTKARARLIDRRVNQIGHLFACLD